MLRFADSHADLDLLEAVRNERPHILRCILKLPDATCSAGSAANSTICVFSSRRVSSPAGR